PSDRRCAQDRGEQLRRDREGQATADPAAELTTKGQRRGRGDDRQQDPAALADPARVFGQSRHETLRRLLDARAETQRRDRRAKPTAGTGGRNPAPGPAGETHSRDRRAKPTAGTGG